MNKLLTALLAITVMATSYAYAQPDKKHQKRIDRIERKYDAKNDQYNDKKHYYNKLDQEKGKKHERVFTDFSGSDGFDYENGERNPHVRVERVYTKRDNHVYRFHDLDTELAKNYKRVF